MALEDGLLVLRYLFGFRGDPLIPNVVGHGCTRCTAAAITGHLDSLGNLLDVDGNGALDSLTDGILLLRFLFGFTDPSLTMDAVGAGCTRCTGPSITAHLYGLIGP